MGPILSTAGYYLFSVVEVLIFANVVLSWIRLSPENPIYKVVYGLTEPLLTPLRKFCVFNNMDFSAFAALLIIQLVISPLYQWIIGTIF